MKVHKNVVLFCTLLFLFAVIAGCGKNANQEKAAAPTAAGDPANGKTVYINNCLSCHGNNGVNGHNGPNLQTSAVSKNPDQVMATVKNGRNMMPTFKDVLSEQQIKDVAAYVQGLAK